MYVVAYMCVCNLHKDTGQINHFMLAFPSHRRTQTKTPQLEASDRNGSASPTGNQGSVPTKMRRNL